VSIAPAASVREVHLMRVLAAMVSARPKQTAIPLNASEIDRWLLLAILVDTFPLRDGSGEAALPLII